MKAFAGLLLMGCLGLVAGSLAAQQLSDEPAPPVSSDLLYEGPLEVELVPSGGTAETLRQNGRVYEEWVDLGDQMYPREQIRRVTMRRPARGDDFGNQPDAFDSATEPGQAPPAKRRPFRED